MPYEFKHYGLEGGRKVSLKEVGPEKKLEADATLYGSRSWEAATIRAGITLSLDLGAIDYTWSY